MKNLCFEDNPEVIADLLNEENVDPSDLLRAVIGLARIVSRQKTEIKELKSKIKWTN